MKITSPNFKEGEEIPVRFTCQGENINPSLGISEVPEAAKTLVLIMEDPDTVRGVFDHWLVWNISAELKIIRENSRPPGVIGTNSAGKNQYDDPCPPSGRHRYFFKLYALDYHLSLKRNAAKTELIEAMKSHILAKSQLMGLFTPQI